MFNLPSSLWSTLNISLRNTVYNCLPLTTRSVLNYQKTEPTCLKLLSHWFRYIPCNSVCLPLLSALESHMTSSRRAKLEPRSYNPPSRSVQGRCTIEMNWWSSSGRYIGLHAVLLYNRQHNKLLIIKPILLHKHSFIMYIATCFEPAWSSSGKFFHEYISSHWIAF
jgi:hypothetical protein